MIPASAKKAYDGEKSSSTSKSPVLYWRKRNRKVDPHRFDMDSFSVMLQNKLIEAEIGVDMI